MDKELAKIHVKYNIYPESLLDVEVDKSIIRGIRDFEPLRYLSGFYDNYLSAYTSHQRSLRQDSAIKGPLKGAARSVDLPFIGPSALRQRKAKYMFVFEGSLQETNRLSITVLSCFWLFRDLTKYRSLIQTYWNPTSYRRIHQSLHISPEIADQSYVIDAFRIGNSEGKRDTKANRSLLLEEIELLQPEIKVLVAVL